MCSMELHRTDISCYWLGHVICSMRYVCDAIPRHPDAYPPTCHAICTHPPAISCVRIRVLPTSQQVPTSQNAPPMVPPLK